MRSVLVDFPNRQGYLLIYPDSVWEIIYFGDWKDGWEERLLAYI